MSEQKFDIIAKTLYGLEPALADEVRSIGGTEIQILKRAVRYQGDQKILYKSNYLLRTALRILKPVATFRIFNDHQLLRKAKRIPWEKYMTVNDTFAIDAVTFGHIFRNSKYIALKTKDAVADRFREVHGRRPNVDIDDPTLRINVHIADKECTVSLDSSGHSLDKRGYKLEQTEASMSEVLAAGIIHMSGWDMHTPFVDPMCGSGSLAIEAAQMAAHIPPGRNQRFAFEGWGDFDRSLWQDIKMEAEKRMTIDVPAVTANDKSADAIEIARKNARRAGVDDFITFSNQDFLEIEKTAPSGTIVINPPYGERLEDKEDLSPFYEEIGTHLKHHIRRLQRMDHQQ